MRRCFLQTKMAASKGAQKFKWTMEMVQDLLVNLKNFKSMMEYRNLDFNADKAKQYEAVRQALSKKYSYFGPESPTLIPEDVDETQKEELVRKISDEKALIKKGYSRVMEKIKEVRQGYSNAVTTGTRSGSGKLVLEYYDIMVQIWGGSPSTEPLPFGVTSVENYSETLLDERSSTTSDTSSLELSEDGNTAAGQATSRKRPITPNPVPRLIDNKRKHMERQLSAAQRDQIMIDEARNDNQSRKELADSLLQSNEVFAQSMQAVSSSMMSIAQSMTRSFELLSHAIMPPQQPLTTRPILPQMQTPYNQQFQMDRPHEGYMHMDSSGHDVQVRENEDINTLYKF